MKENNLDNQETLFLHARIIYKKLFLKKLYTDFYNELLNNRFPRGPIVELGSGAGFIKKIKPQVITSDVIKGTNIDKVFSAIKMPFKNSSISAFLMFDVLHHIKDTKKALNEMSRCLKKNGKIVMIEPYNSFFGRFIFQNFHHENFDPTAGWKIQGAGRLSGANGALSWIIFVRDRKLFVDQFPSLKIVKVIPHTPLRYLLSGGLSHWWSFPSFSYEFIKLLESVLSPLNRFLGMFVTIEIEKK